MTPRRKPAAESDRSRLEVDDDGVWFETQLDDDWTAAYRLIVHRQRLVIGELRIFPTERWHGERRPIGEWSGLSKPARRGITSAVLKLVRLREHRTAAATNLQQLRAVASTEPATRLPAPLHGPARPGRRGRPDAYWANLANEYVLLSESGAPQPIKQLAQLYGTTAPRIRDQVHQARVNGFLTEPPFAGVAGGSLTKKARAVLATGELSVEDLLVLARKQGGLK